MKSIKATLCSAICRTSSSKRNIRSRTLLEARKVAGSATYKQSRTVWNYVCLFKSVWLFRLFRHKQFNHWRFLLQSAPVRWMLHNVALIEFFNPNVGWTGHILWHGIGLLLHDGEKNTCSSWTFTKSSYLSELSSDQCDRPALRTETLLSPSGFLHFYFQ